MPEPLLMSAEELRAALADAGVPVAATIEPRGGAMKLARYWTKGEGAAKIRWGTDGDFNRCVMHLGKFVKDAKGLCNEYHQLAVGAPPGKGHRASLADGPLELARPGKWKLSTGDLEFTDQMLRDAADFYAATGGQGIPIGFGHIDSRFDGDPSFGRITNIRYATDARGPVLLGDPADWQDWLAAAAPKRWPYRSIEGFTNFEYQGRTYALALTRLALLGATPPAIMNLQTLQDAVAAAADASGAKLIAATAPEGDDPDGPQPPTVPEAKEAIDEHVEKFIDEHLTNPQTPPDQGAESSPLLDDHPSTQEGAGMDPAKLREAVGLKPDASDEEVMAALAASGLKAAAPTPPTPPPPTPAPAPGQPADPVDQPSPTPQKVSAGTVVIDASQLAEFQAAARKMEAVQAKLARNERDEAITEAIRKGKFPQARRTHWEKAWDADPEGAKATIESLQANLVPLAASGYAGDADAEFDMDYSALYPPEVKSRG